MGNAGSISSEILPASLVVGLKELRPDLKDLSETELTTAVTADLVAAKFGHKVVPGSVAPDLSLPSPAGGTVSIRAENDRHKLVVFYRGAFCPICLMTLKDLSAKLDALTEGGVDVVIISADPIETTQKLVVDNPELSNLTFGCDLKEETMRKLGLYISDPTFYVPQTYRFNEPAYYFLNPDSTIHYVDVASSPVGGRPNVDVLLMAKGYVAQRLTTDPDFKKVVWGSV